MIVHPKLLDHQSLESNLAVGQVGSDVGIIVDVEIELGAHVGRGVGNNEGGLWWWCPLPLPIVEKINYGCRKDPDAKPFHDPPDASGHGRVKQNACPPPHLHEWTVAVS